MKPTAAKGTFPYPHRNMAQVAAHERGEILSGCAASEPRNANLVPRFTKFGREL